MGGRGDMGGMEGMEGMVRVLMGRDVRMARCIVKEAMVGVVVEGIILRACRLTNLLFALDSLRKLFKDSVFGRSIVRVKLGTALERRDSWRAQYNLMADESSHASFGSQRLLVQTMLQCC